MMGVLLLERLRCLPLQFQVLRRTAILVLAASGVWAGAWLGLLAMLGLLPVAYVYIVRWSVDALTLSLSSGEWRALLPPALSMAAALLLGEVLRAALEWVSAVQSERIRDHVSFLIHSRSAMLDLGFYDSHEFHDRLFRVRREAAERSLSLLKGQGSFLQNGITLAAMASVLLPYAAWLPLLLIASTLPTFWVVVRSNLRYHKWWKESTPERRWIDYYDFALTDSQGAAELRLFNLAPRFRRSFKTLRRRQREALLKHLRVRQLQRLAAGAAGLAVSAAGIAWIAWHALKGSASLGDLALFYQAFQRGQGVIQELLANIGQIHSHSLFLDNLFEFLDDEPQVVSPAAPVAFPPSLKEGIRLQGVTFHYPGSESPSVGRLDLWIPSGRITALVGPNGSGKSTLVKLLCRFYDPQEGRILMDGIDIRSFDLERFRAQVSVLFQMPVDYHASAWENISYGVGGEIRRSDVLQAARASGVHEAISRLPQGYDTVLGKCFVQGHELSVGEWQRLAMARAFLRDVPILILDEPTSFMDPWSERDWFRRLRELACGRTTLLITHRPSIARMADLIHVMRSGEVVESGGHDDLMAIGGLYAESWAPHQRGPEAAPGGQASVANGRPPRIQGEPSSGGVLL